MKMEQTECSETSAYKIQTPGNYPEENIQHTEHGESMKSRKPKFLFVKGNVKEVYSSNLQTLRKKQSTKFSKRLGLWKSGLSASNLSMILTFYKIVPTSTGHRMSGRNSNPYRTKNFPCSNTISGESKGPYAVDTSKSLPKDKRTEPHRSN